MRFLLPCVAALSICGTAAALEIPHAALGSYRTFHDEMFAAGWQPVPWEEKVAFEGYPEVSCGNRSCIARWTDGDRLLEITLWRLDELRLGLQF